MLISQRFPDLEDLSILLTMNLLENVYREDTENMDDEEREEEHLRPLFLVYERLFLTRDQRDPELSKFPAATVEISLEQRGFIIGVFYCYKLD